MRLQLMSKKMMKVAAKGAVAFDGSSMVVADVVKALNAYAEATDKLSYHDLEAVRRGYARIGLQMVGADSVPVFEETEAARRFGKLLAHIEANLPEVAEEGAAERMAAAMFDKCVGELEALYLAGVSIMKIRLAAEEMCHGDLFRAHYSYASLLVRRAVGNAMKAEFPPRHAIPLVEL